MGIQEYLRSQRVWFQTLLQTPAPSASKFARSCHVTGHQVAKSVLLRSADSYVLAVLPATARIDLERFSMVLGGAPVALAGESELEAIFGDCERGALPPFGRIYGLRTIVDASLAASSEIVCVGNSRHEGLRLRYCDYEALESPIHARFATNIEPSAGPDGHLRLVAISHCRFRAPLIAGRRPQSARR